MFLSCGFMGGFFKRFKIHLALLISLFVSHCICFMVQHPSRRLGLKISASGTMSLH